MPKRVFRKKRGRKLNPRQKAEVKRLIGHQIEQKYIDLVSNYAGIVNTGTITKIVMPVAGVYLGQRVGDQITVKSILFNYSVIGYDYTNMFRVLIIKWKNDDASAVPTVSSILNSGSLGADQAPLAGYNWDNWKAGDFRVCYDRLHALSQGNGVTSPGSTVHTVRKKLYGKKLHNGVVTLNTGAVTGEGCYYMVFITDSGVAGHPKVNYTCRTVYTDA